MLVDVCTISVWLIRLVIVSSVALDQSVAQSAPSNIGSTTVVRNSSMLGEPVAAMVFVCVALVCGNPK
ncbi:hypothetical protein D3C87_1984280 [compost metagenome]